MKILLTQRLFSVLLVPAGKLKPRILILIPIAISLLLGAATAQGQSQKLVASIPFDFLVGTQHMSAGRYAVVTGDGRELTIRGLDTSDTAFVLTNSIGSKHPEQEPSRLVFLLFGNQHYLAQFWSPKLQDGRSIQVPKNRQIQASNGNATIALESH